MKSKLEKLLERIHDIWLEEPEGKVSDDLMMIIMGIEEVLDEQEEIYE